MVDGLLYYFQRASVFKSAPYDRQLIDTVYYAAQEGTDLYQAPCICVPHSMYHLHRKKYVCVLCVCVCACACVSVCVSCACVCVYNTGGGYT